MVCLKSGFKTIQAVNSPSAPKTINNIYMFSLSRYMAATLQMCFRYGPLCHEPCISHLLLLYLALPLLYNICKKKVFIQMQGTKLRTSCDSGDVAGYVDYCTLFILHIFFQLCGGRAFVSHARDLGFVPNACGTLSVQ